MYASLTLKHSVLFSLQEKLIHEIKRSSNDAILNSTANTLYGIFLENKYFFSITSTFTEKDENKINDKTIQNCTILSSHMSSALFYVDNMKKSRVKRIIPLLKASNSFHLNCLL